MTVLAHSMGGAVLTRAGQLAPELIAHAVYLAAFMPASGVPPAAYVRMPENEGSRVGALRVGDARATGALRLDVASPDPAYREAVREIFYGDVDPAAAEAAIALLTPRRSRGHQRGRDRAHGGRLGLDPAHLRGVHQGRDDPPGPAAQVHRRRGRRVPRQSDGRARARGVHSPFLSMPDQVAGIVLDVLS